MSDQQPDLFSQPLHHRHFSGSDYVPVKDQVRLTKQIQRIYEAMKSGEWFTLRRLSEVTGAPEASASAQIRNLSKPQFGSIKHEKRRANESGLWEYRLIIK